MHGYVFKWNNSRHFGLIKSDDAKRLYLCISSDVIPDVLGKRRLIEGELVDFEPEFDTETNKWRARQVLAIQRVSRDDAPDLEYREICTVESWNPDAGKGTLSREHRSDALLRFYRSDILTTGIETLKAGSKVWTGVKRVRNTDVFRTHSVEIIIPEGYVVPVDPLAYPLAEYIVYQS